MLLLYAKKTKQRKYPAHIITLISYPQKNIYFNNLALLDIFHAYFHGYRTTYMTFQVRIDVEIGTSLIVWKKKQITFLSAHIKVLLFTHLFLPEKVIAEFGFHSFFRQVVLERHGAYLSTDFNPDLSVI